MIQVSKGSSSIFLLENGAAFDYSAPDRGPGAAVIAPIKTRLLPLGESLVFSYPAHPLICRQSNPIPDTSIIF